MTKTEFDILPTGRTVHEENQMGLKKIAKGLSATGTLKNARDLRRDVHRAERRRTPRNRATAPKRGFQ